MKALFRIRRGSGGVYAAHSADDDGRSLCGAVQAGHPDYVTEEAKQDPNNKHRVIRLSSGKAVYWCNNCRHIYLKG